MKKYLPIGIVIIIAGIGVLLLGYTSSDQLRGNVLEATKARSQISVEKIPESVQEKILQTTPEQETPPQEILSEPVPQQKKSGIFSKITNAVTSLIKPAEDSSILLEPALIPNTIPLPNSDPAIEGVLSVSHFHDFTNHKSTPVVNLITTNKIIPLSVTASTHGLYEQLNGATVRITGTMNGKSFVPVHPPVTIKTAPSPKTQNTSRSGGPHKLSVILFKFANTTNNPPFTKEDVRKNFFEPNPNYGITMSKFLEDSTYGQMSFEGNTSVNGATDVYGWYTVSISRTSCVDQATTYYQAGNEAIRMAIQDGLVLGADNFVVAGGFPDGCPTGGVAGTVLTNGQLYTPTTPAGTPLVRAAYMTNMMSWENTLHELGHVSTKGPLLLYRSPQFIGHSNSFSCSDSNNNPIPWGSILRETMCKVIYYGNPFSIMGGYVSGAQRPRLFDSINKVQAGYLDESNSITANTSGQYDITKINYSDANRLEIPYIVGGSYIGTNTLSPSYQTSFSIEARDFLPYEQGSDTFPHTNILTAHQTFQILSNIGGTNPRLIAPLGTLNLSDLGVSIKNLGATPGDPKKIRVQVTYTKPLNQRIIPENHLTVTKSSAYVQVSPNGAFSQQIVTIKNTGVNGIELLNEGPLMLGSPSTTTIVYPTNPQGNTLSAINTIGSQLGRFFEGIPLRSGESFEFSPLKNLNLNSATLTGASRFIFKINSDVYPRVPESAISTYLVYGQFSTKELVDLGVLGISPAPNTPLTGTTINTPPNSQ